MTARPDVDPWKLEVSGRLIMGATYAAIQPAGDDQHRALTETLKDVESFADLHGGMSDTDYLGALFGLAAVAYSFGNADGPLQLIAEDLVTGRQIDDRDADCADTEDDMEAAAGRGTLAAMRFFTAVANDDPDTAAAVFFATSGDIAGAVFLDTLLQYCGGIIADWMHRDGKFTPEADAKWAARRAADEADAKWAANEAAATPELTVGRDPVTGREFVTIPLDPRDEHPDDKAAIAPHGHDVVYAVSMYRRGTPGRREKVIADAVASSAAMAPGDALCCVHHAEDIEVHELPHSGRRTARRALRDAARDHGGTWQLVRIWQHRGQCTPEDVTS